MNAKPDIQTAAGTPPLTAVSLDDKYRLERGRVFLVGRQALVRLPMLQRVLDRAKGLNTAGFISGYRASPLGGYDAELWKAKDLLEQHDIVFAPGLNEDLAATAVWGTQQVGWMPGRKVDGVFAIWYGKGPGVDRSGDPFKHANLQGTDQQGGVLLVFGDDHAGKSSSTAHQSDPALAANDIPILYPSNVAEVIEYGLAGFALSRYSGLLVGLKLVNEIAETTDVIEIDPAEYQFIAPVVPSSVDVNARKEFAALVDQDRRIVRHKIPRAHAFARANNLDRIVFGSVAPRFVIVTAGKAYPDVCGALTLLGIDEAAAQRIGLSVFKVAMIHPLEPTALKAVAATAEELFFVEEKRGLMERQAAALLFNEGLRLRLSGKLDPATSEPLLPADEVLEPSIVALALARRLAVVCPEVASMIEGYASALAALQDRCSQASTVELASLGRPPAFCAGCPHNSSTSVPEGSVSMAGIGCHSLVMLMPDRRPSSFTHMGGEGANWIGMAPFVQTPHVFQNLGDGTYNHSGSLAIRAAVQARVNITYKILYNDAVAMTGGQPVEGEQTVARIAAQMLAEGVSKVVVVSDNPQQLRERERLPVAVPVHHRDELKAAQEALRQISGVTILIYEQTCATEKRRRRKRGKLQDPDRRVFINQRVCEGCGDCSAQSNCVAVQPLETELGRKREIDQSACNKDFSCVKGFCPSFVTVERARLRRGGEEKGTTYFEDLPRPQLPAIGDSYSILVAGIGGTGVVTIGSIIGMAARLQGVRCTIYDMTGLSQKGGAVLSHVRLLADPNTVLPVRLGSKDANLLLACDAVAAGQREAIAAIDPDKTAVLMNADVSATADFQSKPDLVIDRDQLRRALQKASGGREPFAVAAAHLAVQLIGDGVASNMIMLGYAWQCGLIPLSLAAIERAIALNGVAIELNRRAFHVGRAAAVRSDQALLSSRTTAEKSSTSAPEDLDHFISRRVADLTAYQDARYAQRYATLVDEARRRQEAAVTDEANRFAWAVARGAFKLMAYKDEYEVARLYSDGRFLQDLEQRFEPGYRLEFHLAPPMFARHDRSTGRPMKITAGPWMAHAFRALSRFKCLRGTPFDLFGATSERRIERELRDNYLATMQQLSAKLTAANYEQAVVLAEAAMKVRGYGHVKLPAAKDLLAQLQAHDPSQ